MIMTDYLSDMEKVVLVKVRFKSKYPEVVEVFSNVEKAVGFINENKKLDKYKDVAEWLLSDRTVN